MKYNRMGEWMIEHPKTSDAFYFLIFPFVMLLGSIFGLVEGVLEAYEVWLSEQADMEYERTWRASQAGK